MMMHSCLGKGPTTNKGQRIDVINFMKQSNSKREDTPDEVRSTLTVRNRTCTKQDREEQEEQTTE